MNNPEKIYQAIKIQEYIAGSQNFNITVSTKNISHEIINDLFIRILSPDGVRVNTLDTIESEKTTTLETKKNSLTKELELIIERAYFRQRWKSAPFILKFVIFLNLLLKTNNSPFKTLKAKQEYLSMNPYWAEEALRIEEWDDVINLENEIISFEPEDSFTRKAYKLNKDKLFRLIQNIKDHETTVLKKGITLHPGDSVNIVFSLRSPHLLKSRNSDISIRSEFKTNADDSVYATSVSETIKMHPSSFAVPVGGLFGAMVGYLIKQTLITPNSELLNPTAIIGSLCLGFFMCVLLARKQDIYQAIAVEDFSGGFIIGVLSGIWSEKFLDKLQTIL